MRRIKKRTKLSLIKLLKTRNFASMKKKFFFLKKIQNLEIVFFPRLDLPRKLATFNIFTKMDYFLLNIYRTNDSNIFTIIFRTFWVSGNFLESGNWQSGNLEMPWNWLFFGQFQYVGYFSHSVLVTELDFELRISKFQFFWKFLEFLEIVWKYTIFDHFCKVEHIFHSILVTEFDFPLKSCRF